MASFRLLFSVGACTLALATLPSCGSSDSSGDEVKVAITPTMPYIGLKDGKLTGLDGDLLNRAAADLDLTIKPVAVDFPGLLAGIQTGRYDLGVGGIAWNSKRADAGIFTDPPYYTPVILAEKPGTDASTIADLQGHKLGTVQSFFFIPALQQVPDSHLQTYPTFEAVLQDLDAGRIDIAFLDPLTVLYTKEKDPSVTFETETLTPPTKADLDAHPEYTAFQPYMTGWYLGKGETDLRDQLDKEILSFYEDGTSEDLVKKWGGDPKTLLTPIPDFTEQRTSTDRPDDWTPPSLT